MVWTGFWGQYRHEVAKCIKRRRLSFMLNLPQWRDDEWLQYWDIHQQFQTSMAVTSSCNWILQIHDCNRLLQGQHYGHIQSKYRTWIVMLTSSQSEILYINTKKQRNCISKNKNKTTRTEFWDGKWEKFYLIKCT